MKFIKLLVCMLVVSSLFLEIQGNLIQNQKGKMRSNNKGIFDQIFSNSNKAKVKTTDAYGRKFEFNCMIQTASYKDSGSTKTEPYGIYFDDLKKITSSDKSGFTQNVLGYEKIPGSNNAPILDFRLIKNCKFWDNEGEWFNDWRIEFQVQGKEEYNLQSNKRHGTKWNIRMELPAANKKEAKNTKSALISQCQQRSRQINDFKSEVQRAGDKYYDLYENLLSRQQSLQKQVELGQTQENLLQQAQLRGDSREKQLTEAISQNQQQLADAVKSLQKVQQLDAKTAADINKSNKEIITVKAGLSQLQQKQNELQQDIAETQLDLSEAKQLKNNQTSEATELDEKKKELTQTVDLEKQLLEKTVQEAANKMQRMQEEFEQKQKELQDQLKQQKDQAAQRQTELAGKLASNKNKAVEVAQKIQGSIENIEQLSSQVSMQQRQAQNMDEQIKETEKSLDDLKDMLDSQTSLSEAIDHKLEAEEAMQAQYESDLKAEQAHAKKVLADLEAKEQKQMEQLDQTKEETKTLKEAAAQASSSTQRAYDTFTSTINKFTNKCKSAKVRLIRAQQKINLDQHGSEINMIVSNSNSALKRQMYRFAQLEKSRQKLALAELSKFKQVQAAQKLEMDKKKKKQKKCHGKRCTKKCHGKKCHKKEKCENGVCPNKKAQDDNKKEDQ